MSSCWQWENLMTHAVGFDIFMTSAMSLATKSNFKEASKNFHTAGSYVVSVIDDVLPNWTWKKVLAVETRVCIRHEGLDDAQLRIRWARYHG